MGKRKFAEDRFRSRRSHRVVEQDSHPSETFYVILKKVLSFWGKAQLALHCPGEYSG